MKLIKLIFIVIVVITCLSMQPYNHHYEILSDDDFEMAKIDNERPALSAGLHEDFYWESYIEFICGETNYGGIKNIPIILFDTKQRLFEFDLGPDYNWDCELVIEEWKLLAQEEESFCIFGAYLEELNEEGTYSLYYIEQIKTLKGYWKMKDYENYLLPD